MKRRLSKKILIFFFFTINYVLFLNIYANDGAGMSNLLNREEVEEKYTWDLTKIYKSLDEWKKEYENIKENKMWNEIEDAKSKLIDADAKFLKKFIDDYLFLERTLEKLYVYAHLLFDQDLGYDAAKNAYGLSQILFSTFIEKTSWIEPEILKFSEEKFFNLLNSPELEEYKFFLEKLYRMKPHILSMKEEKILAMTTQPFSCPPSTFSAMDNSDLKFDSVKDKDNNIYTLTHGKYGVYMRDQDRVLRKSAFENLHKKYLDFENTFCELLQGSIRSDVFRANVRNFKTCLDAALFSNKVDKKVYYNLIETVRENFSTLHKFIELKKKILGLKKFNYYDIYAPMVKDVKYSKDIEEAKDIVINSVGILGENYQNILKKGLNEERWVDFIENNKKRSGGYSSGCYDTNPYILMNFHGSLNDISTLAHESGHSMHSYLSHKNQKYQYANYSIFLAEIASTFNELLLQDYLEKNIDDNHAKAFIIADNLDRLQATFFRQTLFAEFELKIHEYVEKGGVLTPEYLKGVYGGLLKEYYGPNMETDDFAEIEWARIPHFYRSFYVYQYATGVSTAVYFFNAIKKDKNVCKEYLKFLQSGGSRYPLDVLKAAKVDLTDKKVIEAMIDYFNNQMEELSTLLKK